MSHAHPNATLVHRTDLAPGLHVLRIRPDGGVPAFAPGQYVALGLVPGDDMLRDYTIASAPHEDTLEFYVSVVDDGAFTSRLERLAEGDRLFCTPSARGTFTLDDVPEECNLVFVATGTGLAPFVSMLRHLVHRGRVDAAPRRIVCVHGVREEADLGYRAELERYSRAFPDHLVYLPTVTRDDGFSGERSRIPQLFDEGGLARALGRPLDPARDHVYLCGNPGMVDAMAARLESIGYVAHSPDRPGPLHLEKYW